MGLLYAKNDIIIFLDEDVVIPKDFLANHLSRHGFFKCIIVGLRHGINFRNFKNKIVKSPDYTQDFRYKKFIPSEWKSTYKEVPQDNFNKICYPLIESNYFKKFGYGRIFGVWELPFMFLTSNASVSRHEIIKIGGFDMRFKGWGMEDVHLAAKLIANGLYLIPNLNTTVYHLLKKSLEKERKKRIKEYEKNFNLYNKIKNENLLISDESHWKEKMKKFFANKFIAKYFLK